MLTSAVLQSPQQSPRSAWADYALPAVLPAVALATLGLLGAGGELLAGAVLAYLAVVAGVSRQASRHRAAIGWASRVTLTRAGLVVVLGAALVVPHVLHEQAWWLVGLAGLVLALDGVDGSLARRLGESSAFGARFDMEVDAALILVLCVAVMMAGLAGPWVLAIGLMRYAFVGAARLWPWLSAPLPPSLRRKVVCVWQVAALMLSLTPVIGPALAVPILGSALVTLALSFAADVAWLRRNFLSDACWQESL